MAGDGDGEVVLVVAVVQAECAVVACDKMRADAHAKVRALILTRFCLGELMQCRWRGGGCVPFGVGNDGNIFQQKCRRHLHQ